MKSLQFIALVFLLFAFSPMFQAQGQKCKFDSETTDKFTGAHSQTMHCKISKSWKLILSRTNDKPGLAISILLGGQMHQAIRKGDTMLLALEDSEPLIFISKADASPTSGVIGTGTTAQVVTSYLAAYECTDADFKKISENLPVAIRVQIASMTYSVDFGKKHSKKTMEKAKCLVKK